RRIDAPGLHAEVLEVDPGTAKFDLSLEMVSETDSLSGSFEYNTDLFDEAMIQRMADHFLRVLEGIAVQPDSPVSTVPLLSDAERHELLISWNATDPLSSDVSTPSSAQRTAGLQQPCLHELFEAQVARTPNAVAIVWNGLSLTYEELNGRANQVARYLREQGVGPESLVAICVERSLDMAVALLGVLKAGGAYLPLDPGYPAQRIGYIIEDAQAAMLLTHARLRPLVPTSPARVVSLDEDWAEIGSRSSVNLPNLSDVESLAYVIYTSGSTGRPKGVGITHRSAAALIHWAHSVYAPDDLQGVLASTSICFDLSVFELFVPLTVGGRVIVAENALALSTIKESETVTLINTV
ncbi:MAG: AMP-binding protein, partial [Acidimicrobiia bacterium]